MIKWWICTKTFWQNSARKQVWNQRLHIFKVKWISCVLCESNHKYYYECRKANIFLFSSLPSWHEKQRRKNYTIFPHGIVVGVTEFFKLKFWGKKKRLMQEIFFFWTFTSDGLFNTCLCTHTHTCTYLFTNDVWFFPPRVLFQIKQQQRRKNIRICSNKSTSAKNACTQPSLER